MTAAPERDRPLAGRGPDLQELDPAALAVTSADGFVTAELDPAAGGRGVRAFRLGSAEGWLGSRSSGPGWFTCVGGPADAAALTSAVAAARCGGLDGLTVPRAALPLLPCGLRPARVEDWDFFRTAAAPAPQPAEGLVVPLDAVTASEPAAVAEVRDLLAVASPTHSAVPGSPAVGGWCGVRDDAGALLAVGAWVRHGPGVPHLASIATREDARGRGLGAAVTAWLTRRRLVDADVVTLGMYASNTNGRRLYERLGFTLTHAFSSGALRPREGRFTEC